MPALQDYPMTEDAQLDAALRKADDVLVASLRREEAARQSKRRWLTVLLAFAAGLALGAGGMWLGTRNPAHTTTTPSAIAPPSSASVPITAPPAPTTGPCEVKQGNQWKRAAIIDRDRNIFKIKYDGWDDFFDEWVTPDRIRPIGSKWDALGYARPTPHGEKPPQPANTN